MSMDSLPTIVRMPVHCIVSARMRLPNGLISGEVCGIEGSVPLGLLLDSPKQRLSESHVNASCKIGVLI